MIAAALEAEVDEYVGSFAEEVGEDGKRLVVRNGQRARAGGDGRVGDGRDPGAAGERQARRRGAVSGSGSVRRSCRRTPPVAEGDRGAADPVSARALDR